MTAIYHFLIATSSRITSSPNGFLNLTLTVHCTQTASGVSRSRSVKIPSGGGGAGDLHQGCASDKTAAIFNTWLNQCQNVLRQFCRQKRAQPAPRCTQVSVFDATKLSFSATYLSHLKVYFRSNLHIKKDDQEIVYFLGDTKMCTLLIW